MGIGSALRRIDDAGVRLNTYLDSDRNCMKAVFVPGMVIAGPTYVGVATATGERPEGRSLVEHAARRSVLEGPPLAVNAALSILSLAGGIGLSLLTPVVQGPTQAARGVLGLDD